MSKKEVQSSKSALTDTQIRAACKANNIHCLILDLKENFKPIEKIAFVFTGSDETPINNGVTHHWIFKLEDQLFDSYGKQPDSYPMPEGLTLMTNSPNQYQGFAPDSVCGEYCCILYATYLHNMKVNKNYNYKNTSKDMADIFQLTNDRIKNDETILKAFNKFKRGKLDIEQYKSKYDSESESESDKEETKSKDSD